MKNSGKRIKKFEAVITTDKSYPVFDSVVLWYVTAVLLIQVLFQISPVMTLLTKTPIYSAQTYLGILGCGLIVIDFFTSKKMWRGSYCVLLFGICAIAAVASVREISYGIKENIFKLCWAAIQFAICYSCAYRTDRERFKKIFTVIYFIWLAIWVAACCVSLYQYAKQIKYAYVVNPLAKDSSTNRQGFYDNRLFGIFYTLNHAAYVSLILLLVGIIKTIKIKKTTVRIILIISGVILLSHIILSGSRSAFVALVVCVACLGFVIGRNIAIKKAKTKWLSILFAVTFALIGFVTYTGIKTVLPAVPYLVEKYSLFEQIDGEIDPDDKTPGKEFDENLLERENLEEDPSNGRLSIWKDYIRLFKDIGPIGLSPGNYMGYVYENCQELYIVDYIKTNYPAKYESGIIYHVHNGYLMVYVSAGWIGTLLLVAFIVLCARKLVKKFLEGKDLPSLTLCVLLLVIAVGISAVFDEGIFFQNNPQTTVFWIALGVLMKECAASEIIQEH